VFTSPHVFTCKVRSLFPPPPFMIVTFSFYFFLLPVTDPDPCSLSPPARTAFKVLVRRLQLFPALCSLCRPLPCSLFDPSFASSSFLCSAVIRIRILSTRNPENGLLFLFKIAGPLPSSLILLSQSQEAGFSPPLAPPRKLPYYA